MTRTIAQLAVISLVATGCGGELPKLDHGGGGIELTVTCKGSVPEAVFTTVVVDGKELHCGGLGNTEGQDATAIFPGSPVQVGSDILVRWRIVGTDDEQETTLETKAFAAAKDQIKSAGLEYHGDGEWALKFYDGIMHNPARGEVKPAG